MVGPPTVELDPRMIRAERSVVPDMSKGPNLLVVGWSVLRSLLTVRSPGPFGDRAADHRLLGPVLDVVADRGTPALGDLENDLHVYIDQQADIAPDELARDEALAYWINLYNAGALALAGRAMREGKDSVLGVPGGFQSKIASIDGESLSLDDIEHGKLRRFRDPRIHAALVCGSVSCPTLRGEPYTGGNLDGQLEDQIRSFLAAGAIVPDRAAGVIRLSRVFLWFGADFVRPHRMPIFLPVPRKRTLDALTPWLDREVVEWIEETKPDVAFQPYDWGLRCVVR